MSFLVILLALAAEFTLGSFAALRSARWSRTWAAAVSRWCDRYRWWRGWLAVTLLVGLPGVAAALVCGYLASVSMALYYALSLVVLVLMFGPLDLPREVEAYKDALAAAELGDGAMPQLLESVRGIELGAARGDAEFNATRGELAALAIAAERAWFQPLFWFFVLGPVGALLYRLVANLHEYDEFERSIVAPLHTAREALEFVPARVTAFSLGIAGTLMPVFETVRSVGVPGWGHSTALVAQAALAASDHGRIRELISGDARVYRINQMLALLKRALAVWLVVLAVAELLFA